MRRTSTAFLAFALSCSGSAARLENLHEVAPGVLSGAGPQGEAAFRELAALGVRTVISVDGATPDVDAAKRAGLRYVHLPIGYDGVAPERALELAKAIRELPGPVYVHCHHGMHRGPAAAAVACVVAGKLDNEGALRVMREMGTGEHYLGLWASAREAKPADTSLLEVSFREIAPVPPIAEAMVHLDHAFENLDLSRKAGWTSPAGHPDVDPPHEALRAREILTEILRTDEFAARPADYRGWMRASLEAAAEMEGLLRGGTSRETLDAAQARFRKTCADCHKAYRNAPKRPR